AKVVLSLSRDAQQFGEASLSASAGQPGLAIEQLFAQPGQRQQLTDSGHGESLGRRPVYRTELTFATRANDAEEGDDPADDAGFEFRAADDFVGLTSLGRGGAGAAATAAATVDDSTASTVGLQITSFQGRLHDSLHHLQADLRVAVPHEDRATSAEAGQVVARHASEANFRARAPNENGARNRIRDRGAIVRRANRPGSPSSVDARVQRLVQQEVELAIGLSADRLFAGAPAAVAAGNLDDGEDSGLAEPESRLAEFVVQKFVDDHLAALAEAAAASAADRRDSAALPSYRPLPHALTPAKPQQQQPDEPAGGGFRLRNDFGGDISFATSSGSVSLRSRGNRRLAKTLPLAGSFLVPNLDQRRVDQHIDSLFAFNSSDSCGGEVQAAAADQRASSKRSVGAAAAASTPKPSLEVRRRQSDRLAAQPPLPPCAPADGLRVGRFSARFVHDSVGDDEDGGVESWELAAPVLPLAADAEPMMLRFSGFDWELNERTDPRFCAKPDALVSVARGERVCLRAVVDGSEPFEVVWHRLKSGRAFEIGNSDKFELESDPHGDGSHCLTLYHAADADAGAYLILAANAQQAVLHGFHLQVTENPRPAKPPEFTQPMSDTRSREGRTARFACRVAGQPRPRVSFLRDGKPSDRMGVCSVVRQHLPHRMCSLRLGVDDVACQLESRAWTDRAALTGWSTDFQLSVRASLSASKSRRWKAEPSRPPPGTAPLSGALLQGRPYKTETCELSFSVSAENNDAYELRINNVAKSDDAEYSCLATNSAGSTQCDCQLLVYSLAEDDEALSRIEGEIEQTQASMIAAAKDMYRASGKIRQLDANFGRLNKRLSSMERQLVAATADEEDEAYPESAALQRVTGHMLSRLAEHEQSAANTTGTAEASSLVWSSPSGPTGFSTSSFEAVPQSTGSSRIVYEIENVVEDEEEDRDGVSGEEASLRTAATTERRIYVAASKTDLLRQKLDALEQQILSSSVADADSETERSVANLQLLADRQENEVAAIEAAADQLSEQSGQPGSS
uniref:Ig-like domain-containing protein n=1 Tax=Macrostomum lignano TaxID=282301 RepID=A0A1I8IWK5_9PLAT